MKRNRVYIFAGILTVIVVLATFFVFKVFGSEDDIYVSQCTPYNVDIRKGKDENSVEISWESKEKCTGYILYGSAMKELEMVGIDLENDIQSRRHLIVVDELVSTKMYYFTIISEKVSYGKDGLPLQFSLTSL